MADLKNAEPSIDPANNDSMTGAFRHILNKFLQNTDDMLPAKVIAFDRARGVASVQPLIAVVSTAGQQLPRAQVASIPVLQLGGGGYMLNFNINPGDLGWIKANDRDISLFAQSFAQSSPNTKRKHSFEDAIFIPHIMTGYTINGEDQANAVLQSLDGTVRIALWPDRVKITAPMVVLDTPLTHLTGDIQIDGDAVGGTVSLQHHIHSDAGGTGDSGPPVP